MRLQKKYSLTLLMVVLLQPFVFAQLKNCSETCNNSIEHEYKSCIDFLHNILTETEDGILTITTSGIKVSSKEETELGEQTLAEMKNKYKFISSGTKIDNLNRIMQKLVPHIQHPRDFSFSLYLMDTSEINAWTCGGKIFFTTGMYDFCNNNDEIAFVLGHEISHNLLEHMNRQLLKLKAAGKLGVVGQVAAIFGMIATSSFGQRDEAHSDLLGVDLAHAAGYRECESIKLWNRMAEKKGKTDKLSSFLSTHPSSEARAECISAHIKKTYSGDCGN